jgi:NAD(P)-dependent dehydrogenase (short-subunit alcohol dehydrogenase family)
LSARRVRNTSSAAVVVIGLGRFGAAVAQSLVRLGHEVLAIDEDPILVERYSDDLTHVVQADSTDEEALRQLGVGQFDKAVVAIGTEVEASVLTVLALTEAGVTDVWAKAISRKHGQILERVGAAHVVYPDPCPPSDLGPPAVGVRAAQPLRGHGRRGQARRAGLPPRPARDRRPPRRRADRVGADPRGRDLLQPLLSR